MTPSGFSWKDIERRVRGQTYRPLIIAHRGSSGTAPENTLASFRQAIAAGADAIECDVRLSKDGRLVVIHDATVKRTTNGRGRVCDKTFAELRSLDAGSWFHRSYAGERIPTLEEVLDVVDGSVGLNIEIKPTSDTHSARQIVEKCLSVVRSYRAHRYTLLTSFQHSLLDLVSRSDPSALVGLLYHPLHHQGKSPLKLAMAYDARVTICAVRFLRKAMVDAAHRRGIAVAAYTVNDRHALQRCLRLGIEGIVTNEPDKVRRMYRED